MVCCTLFVCDSMHSQYLSEYIELDHYHHYHWVSLLLHSQECCGLAICPKQNQY